MIILALIFLICVILTKVGRVPIRMTTFFMSNYFDLKRLKEKKPIASKSKIDAGKEILFNT